MNKKFVKLLEALSPEEVAMRGLVKEHLDHLKTKALTFWPDLAKIRMFKNIKLEYTNDLGDAMAKAWMSLNTIEIELESLAKQKDRMFDEVIGHELCHLMVPMIYKGVGYKDEELHGKEWQEIMNKMGFAIDPIDLEN